VPQVGQHAQGREEHRAEEQRGYQREVMSTLAGCAQHQRRVGHQDGDQDDDEPGGHQQQRAQPKRGQIAREAHAERALRGAFGQAREPHELHQRGQHGLQREEDHQYSHPAGGVLEEEGQEPLDDQRCARLGEGTAQPARHVAKAGLGVGQNDERRERREHALHDEHVARREHDAAKRKATRHLQRVRHGLGTRE